MPSKLRVWIKAKVCKVSVCFIELEVFAQSHGDQETFLQNVDIEDAKKQVCLMIEVRQI